MQKLAVIIDPFEAQMVSEKLESLGIPTESHGARDYASIVTGKNIGRYEIYVDDENLAKAQQILRELNLRIAPVENPDVDDDHLPPNYLKRSVAFAIFGTAILPIVFNVFSVINLIKYWNDSLKDSRAKAIVLAILLLQIPSIVIAYVFLYSYFIS